MSNIPFYLEAIGACLHSGQASAKKIDAQRALEGLRVCLERDRLKLEADACALWAYRVIGRYYVKAGGMRGEWMLSDAMAIENADRLVAADPSLDPDGVRT
jgi:hypothetical protein